jgi:putative thiamine transport system substrate-binding protein
VPWSMAQLVFLYDIARVPQPPRTPVALLSWAKAHPGRFTYPQPPDFLGTTFLKQLLLNLAPQRDILYESVVEADFKERSRALWDYLDQLHPAMWRQARVFPVNGPAQTRLLADDEVDLAFSFSAEAASAGILTGHLPDTVRTFVFEGGTIGNASFLAIPYNSRAKEGALVLINFLLSPEAQARKQDPRQLGSLTVLALDKLTPADRKLFDDLPRGIATLSLAELGKPIAEPHPSWMDRLEKEWQQRYGYSR